MDSEEVIEPDFDPQVESLIPWWERYYLKNNPFPLKDGLSRNDRSLYDDVVLKTAPYNKVLSDLKRNPEALFDGATLFCGPFGYGKTTLMDYLDDFLIRQSIVTFRMTSIRSFPDGAGFLDSFCISLRDKLGKESSILNVKTPAIREVQIEDAIVSLCHGIQSQGKPGVVVFLDDYHKHKSSQQQVYEFLGLLQILKNSLTRNVAVLF